MSKKEEGKGKLSEDYQKKAKGFSKILEIFTKIGIVFAWIGIVCLAIVTIAVPLVMKDVKITETSISYKEEKVEFKENEGKLDVIYKDKKQGSIEGSDKETIEGVLKNVKAEKVTAAILVVTISGIVLLVISLMMFKSFIKIITSINEDPTPFNAENPVQIRKIGKLMLISFIITFVSNEVVDALTNGFAAAETDFSELLLILGVFLLSYIFEYGFELQKESDSTMYDRQ